MSIWDVTYKKGREGWREKEKETGREARRERTENREDRPCGVRGNPQSGDLWKSRAGSIKEGSPGQPRVTPGRHRENETEALGIQMVVTLIFLP